MDDFREELSAAVHELTAAGVEPVLLVIELIGADDIKRTQGISSFEEFRASVAGALSSAGENCPAFFYGETRVCGVLAGFARLKTFALIERLRRALPLLAQSYDCTVTPDFELVEYAPDSGVAGFVNHLIQLSTHDRHVA